ncbi:hypothetical protein DAI22_01g205300 [Oryza sativa Japonica Group]|nr:hypothetical protein DAI22_01g205300 [Oryza sativa Japonica Group]
MAAARTWRRGGACLVVVALLILLVAIVSPSEATSSTSLGRRQVRSLLKRLNKPPLATFQSPDGDTIDCVHISRQPAFDHPLLKNHTIQWMHDISTGMYDEAAHPFTQTWNQNGEKCPDNTIPIRRTKEEDVMRATSVTTFGKKTHNGSPHSHLAGVTDGHHYGVAYATGNAKYYGTKVTINVWKPKIATSRDFSMAQLWITAGSYANKDLNTIEAGWQVYPAMYGDDKTRLFIYWTRDAYNRTGCYNLACSGFIQTNPQFVIGGSISPVSIYSGTQYDPARGNWWLQVQGKYVGYWPSSIFTRLRTGVADTVEWGGEVYSPRITTPMGSGHFPEEGFGRATYSRAIQVVDSSNHLKPPKGVGLIAPLPNCYNVIAGSSSTTNWGTYIYYGGPECPRNSQIEVM